jgi:putative membrane protein
MSNSSDSGATRSIARKASLALMLFVVLLLAVAVSRSDDPDSWIKALHVIAVISWMAGLFYLPRLFIYHTESQPGSAQSDTFIVMERRLLKIIMNPAMMISWAAGLWLAWSLYQFHGGWLHVKLLCVVLMTAAHMHFAKAVRQFSENQRVRTTRYWRLANEVPTVLMIVIVIMVIVKPF